MSTLNVVRLARALRAAAGPNVPLIGLTYPDVILGTYVYPSQPPTPAHISLAQDSVLGFKLLLNPALSRAYASGHGVLVDVTKATGAYTPLTTTTTLAPYGAVPVAVAKVCTLTWYCKVGKHPRNHAGVRLHRSARRGPLRHHGEGMMLPSVTRRRPEPVTMGKMAKTSMTRRLAGGALLLVVTSLLLTACSSANNSGNKTAATSTTSTTPAPTTTATTVATTGQLQVSSTVAVPVPANVQITAAEAPDGAVFVSPEGHDAATTTVVWVVDPKGPAEIAEHVNGGVSALAADATNLYVVADNSVIGYTRSTGNQMGQWKLPADQHSEHVRRQPGLDERRRRTGPGHDRPRQRAGHLPDCADLDGRTKRDRRGNQRRLRPRRIRVLRTIGQPPRQAESGGRQHRRTGARQQSQRGRWRHCRCRRGGRRVGVDQRARRDRDSTPSWNPYDADTLQPMGSYTGSVTEQIVDTSAGRSGPRWPQRAGRVSTGDRSLRQLRVPYFADGRAEFPDASGNGRPTARSRPGGRDGEHHDTRSRGGPALVDSGSARSTTREIVPSPPSSSPLVQEGAVLVVRGEVQRTTSSFDVDVGPLTSRVLHSTLRGREFRPFASRRCVRVVRELFEDAPALLRCFLAQPLPAGTSIDQTRSHVTCSQRSVSART